MNSDGKGRSDWRFESQLIFEGNGLIKKHSLFPNLLMEIIKRFYWDNWKISRSISDHYTVGRWLFRHGNFPWQGLLTSNTITGLPSWGSSGKVSACQGKRCKRGRFSPWAGKIPWRRTWPPTPVFLPGESHGQRSLAGYGPWGHKSRTWNHHYCHLQFLRRWVDEF